MAEIDDSDDETKAPSVTIAFEYIEAEETFNFYIRKVSGIPVTPSICSRYSRAVMYIVKGLSRKTWMGRKRSITWEEMLAHDPLPYRTLSVSRCFTTVFNEFFTCQIPKQVFHSTLLRIQFCDVSKDDVEVPIAEYDYWIDTNPIERFREFELPLTLATPDLGELELSTTYLPTAQRLLLTNCRVTNLRVDPSAEEIHVRGILFLEGRFYEIHKSEHRKPSEETANGWQFARRLVFDLLRKDLDAALLVCQVVQTIKGRKRVIGQCEVRSNSGQWYRMLDSLREPTSETYRLRPAV